MRAGIVRVGVGLLAVGALMTAGQQPPSIEEQARLREKAAAQSAAAQSALIRYLNGIGYAQLGERAARVASLDTRAEAEARQADVRRRIADLVGGGPRATGPVVTKRCDTTDEDGFRVENIAYKSVPGYWVTANVYVPPGAGPFPAMLIAPGHGAGKASQRWASRCRCLWCGPSCPAFSRWRSGSRHRSGSACCGVRRRIRYRSNEVISPE